jgi:hypothetical protein
MAPKLVYADHLPGSQQKVIGPIGKIYGRWRAFVFRSTPPAKVAAREIVFFYRMHSDDDLVELASACY